MFYVTQHAQMFSCRLHASCAVTSVGFLRTHCCCHAVQGIDEVNSGLIYSCEGLSATVAAGEIASGVDPNQVDPNYQQAFNLASRPAATKKIW
jgi:hypothetical protein